MNVRKQLNKFDTLQPSSFSEMVKRLMRCMVPEKRGCMIACGCTPEDMLELDIMFAISQLV